MCRTIYAFRTHVTLLLRELVGGRSEGQIPVSHLQIEYKNTGIL